MARSTRIEGPCPECGEHTFYAEPLFPDEGARPLPWSGWIETACCRARIVVQAFAHDGVPAWESEPPAEASFYRLLKQRSGDEGSVSIGLRLPEGMWHVLTEPGAPRSDSKMVESGYLFDHRVMDFVDAPGQEERSPTGRQHTEAEQRLMARMRWPASCPWTPVKEGLPNEKGRYQLSMDDGVVTAGLYCPEDEHPWHCDGGSCDHRVLAWAPLPEPWKG